MELIKSIIKLQIVKFIIAGAICAFVEFSVFNLLLKFSNINYLIANIISIIVAVSLNYILSRTFVFEKSRYSKNTEILSFVLFSILALALNQCILWFFAEVVELDLRICKALAIGFVAAFNYLTKKYIVFKK